MKHATAKEFSFDTIMDRADSTVEIHVVCRAESLAAVCGFPDEPSRFRDVSIIRTEHRGLPLTDDERAELLSQAIDHLRFH